MRPRFGMVNSIYTPLMVKYRPPNNTKFNLK